MELVLRVVGWPDEVTDRPPLIARFDHSGGLIGRAETARLSLPDPKRTVSRFHSHVSYDAGAFFLEDMGSTNPPLVNGRPIPVGQRHQIRPGDRLRIGQYTVAVEFEDPDFPSTMLLDPATRIAEHDEETSFERTQVIVREAAGLRSSVAVEEFWRAFLEGAQIDLDLPQGPRPELMRLVGGILRSLLAGVRRLAMTRSEAHAEPDSAPLRSRDNNPLRFAADDRRALIALLKPPAVGFLPGSAAVDELLYDMTQHSAASRAAAISLAERILTRIAPTTLERRINSAFPLLLRLPWVRKARLWDVYLEEMRTLGAGNGNASAEMLRKAYGEALAAELSRMRKARRREAAAQQG
jgi:type VI secretion system protein ImpI